MTNEKKKIIATNRRARHFYHIDRTYEAGLALLGPEVKSLRQGKANLEEAYARPVNNELFLFDMHVSPYTEAGRYNPPDPRRPRKLLLKRHEINRLISNVTQKGYTIIPLSLYFSERGIAKVELGLARGKKVFDRRDDIKQRIQHREMERELKHKKKFLE